MSLSGHTSFIKVLINGTKAISSHQVSHEGLYQAGNKQFKIGTSIYFDQHCNSILSPNKGKILSLSSSISSYPTLPPSEVFTL